MTEHRARPEPPPPPAGLSRRARRVATAITVALSLGLALLVAEAALRLASPAMLDKARARQGERGPGSEPHPRGLYRLDPAIGWTLTPGFEGRFKKPDFDVAIRVNRDGIREQEVGEKRPGAFRIVGLGDSFAFGWGVEAEDTFLAVLGRALDAEVINCGIPGFGTYEAGRLLESLALGYQPDLVLLAFYEGNDYRNNQEAPRTRRIADGYLADAPGESSGAWRAVVRASRVAALLELQRSSFAIKRGLAEGVAKTRRYLGEMQDLLAERGVRLVVVVIPDQDAEVYDRSRLARAYDRLAAGLDASAARAEIERFCRERGIAYVRLSSAFEDAAGARDLRLSEQDVHFNRLGHERAAAEIARFLLERVLPAGGGPGGG